MHTESLNQAGGFIGADSRSRLVLLIGAGATTCPCTEEVAFAARARTDSISSILRLARSDDNFFSMIHVPVL